jgi:carbon monoxide dehydrogenase subunit G
VRPVARNGELTTMDMTGERRIPAPREMVWEALNDPDILKASIPGCESLVKDPDTGGFRATAAVKIGPISAKFSGKVELLDLDPPNGYRIAGEGQGGVAGFAKGGATVTLAPDGADTILKYDVKAQVGGKIAQLGARLIDATAKQLSDAFFDRFSALVAPTPEAAVPVTDEHGSVTTAAPSPASALPPPKPIGLLDLLPREPLGFPLVAWGGAAIFLVILLLMSGIL